MLRTVWSNTRLGQLQRAHNVHGQGRDAYGTRVAVRHVHGHWAPLPPPEACERPASWRVVPLQVRWCRALAARQFHYELTWWVAPPVPAPAFEILVRQKGIRFHLCGFEIDVSHQYATVYQWGERFDSSSEELSSYSDHTAGAESASSASDDHDGVALAAACHRKRLRYPELLRPGPHRFLVLACEVGGRWSADCCDLVRVLVRVRTQRVHPAARRAASTAYMRRWWHILSCAQQGALAPALLGELWVAPAQPAAAHVPLSELLSHSGSAAPSALPLRG
eukprot:Skav232231  [mRNA]  locus=scaffold4367:62556:63930:- [translate_table: standard]